MQQKSSYCQSTVQATWALTIRASLNITSTSLSCKKARVCGRSWHRMVESLCLDMSLYSSIGPRNSFMLSETLHTRVLSLYKNRFHLKMCMYQILVSKFTLRRSSSVTRETIISTTTCISSLRCLPCMQCFYCKCLRARITMALVRKNVLSKQSKT